MMARCGKTVPPSGKGVPRWIFGVFRCREGVERPRRAGRASIGTSPWRWQPRPQVLGLFRPQSRHAAGNRLHPKPIRRHAWKAATSNQEAAANLESAAALVAKAFPQDPDGHTAIETGRTRKLAARRNRHPSAMECAGRATAATALWLTTAPTAKAVSRFAYHRTPESSRRARDWKDCSAAQSHLPKVTPHTPPASPGPL